MKEGKLVWRIGSFQRGSYPEKELHLISDEFEEIKAKEYLYDIPSDWDSLTSFKVPRRLSADSQEHGGVERLSFRFPLSLGTYLFKFSCSEGIEKNYSIIFFDDKEIASFAIPSAKEVKQGGLKLPFVKKERIATHEYRFSFVCAADGIHTLTIETKSIPLKFTPKSYMVWVDKRPWRREGIAEGSSYEVDAFELREYTPCQAPSLLKEHPGRVYLDAWGWEFSPIYMREKKLGERREVGLEYAKRKAIDESHKWGANSLEVCPTPLNMSWSKDDAIKGAEVYARCPSPSWNDETYKKLTQYAHRRDLLIHWFIGTMQQCASSLGWVQDEEKLMPWNFNLAQKIIRDFANPFKDNWKKSLDGYGHETNYMLGDLAVSTLTERGWMYNPGLYQYEYMHTLWIYPTITPGISPAFLDYCETVGLGHIEGRDDKFPVVIYGDDYLHSEYGKVYQLYESSTRARARLDGRVGGRVHPDWVLKQCNDFFRERAKRPDDIHSTAIWWLVEEGFYLGENRPYIYGISQDPIKCAVASSLKTTGKGGYIDRTHFIQHKPGVLDALGSIVTRNRCPYSHKASFIQNNYFRLYIDSEKDKAALFYDLEALAHYDHNSLSINITEGLIKTTIPNKPSPERIGFGCKYPEPAGYRAILKEELALKLAKSELKEIRSYEANSDSPYFKVTLNREWLTSPQALDTQLTLPDYDKLTIEDTVYTDQAKFSDISIIYLESTKSLKPDIAVLLLREGNIKDIIWHPSSHLILKSASSRKETIELAVVFPEGLYTKADLKLLYKSLAQEEELLTIDDLPKTIKNELSLPLVKVLKIKEAPLSPYLVKEYGWWVFRGAQVSQQDEYLDYLKVYLPAKGEASIQPYGFIDDIAKPGWGSQYILALKDIKAESDTLECKAKVFSVTPLIFAPRLQFKKKIVSAELNGKYWHYFDEDLLFLPNKEGVYHIKVETKGEVLPHITRTFALVKEMSWDKTKRTLTLKTFLPPWSKKIPPRLYFTAILNSPHHQIEKIIGGTIVSREDDKLLFKFKPGEVEISFKD